MVAIIVVAMGYCVLAYFLLSMILIALNQYVNVNLEDADYKSVRSPQFDDFVHRFCGWIDWVF